MQSAACMTCDSRGPTSACPRNHSRISSAPDSHPSRHCWSRQPECHRVRIHRSNYSSTSQHQLTQQWRKPPIRSRTSYATIWQQFHEPVVDVDALWHFYSIFKLIVNAKLKYFRKSKDHILVDNVWVVIKIRNLNLGYSNPVSSNPGSIALNYLKVFDMYRVVCTFVKYDRSPAHKSTLGQRTADVIFMSSVAKRWPGRRNLFNMSFLYDFFNLTFCYEI